MIRSDIIDTERRTPAESARAFLLTLCVIFTVVMIACMTLGAAFADEQARRGIDYCWSVLGACVVAAGLQFVFFTPVIIRSLPYPVRLLLFGICLYGALAALAAAMGWFPLDMAGAWVTFTLLYLAILAVATVIFSWRLRRESHRLNERLREYRSREMQRSDGQNT